MSTQTFVNALIGLAREYKTAERRLKRPSKKYPYGFVPQFGDEVADYMAESGYFNAVDVNSFGMALDQVLEMSDPRRKAK